jgi:hypothetical protein
MDEIQQARDFGQAKWVEGKIEAVLAARGLSVGHEARARIAACRDAGALDRWIARSMTAASAEDVLSEPE